MPSLFKPETLQQSSQTVDRGKLRELDSHQLLEADETPQTTNFDTIKQMGKWFLEQRFNAVLPSDQPLPLGLLQRHVRNGNDVMMGKLVYGTQKTDHFPVTIEVVTTGNGFDLKLHIVAVSFEALEVAQFAQHTDSLLALAAAAAVAPQFVLSLREGVATTQCSTKKDSVSQITPDHGTPLVVGFESFFQGNSALQTAQRLTQNHLLSVKQAAHLHGQNKPAAELLSTTANHSKIAGGIELKTLLRTQLGKHVLMIPTHQNATGQVEITTMNQALALNTLSQVDLSFVAAALGFTAHVVRDSEREQKIERLLTPRFAETPLQDLM